MAEILDQSDIDKKIQTADNAKRKILNNYQEIVGNVCVYDLFNKNELILCLKEIISKSGKTKEQNEFISQCTYILNCLINKKKVISV